MSTRTIWKYSIQIMTSGVGRIQMPAAARILAVGNEGPDTVVFWAEHEINERLGLTTRAFEIIGTGHEVPDGGEYVGTTQTAFHPNSSPYFHPGPVWHLYEIPHV